MFKTFTVRVQTETGKGTKLLRIRRLLFASVRFAVGSVFSTANLKNLEYFKDLFHLCLRRLFGIISIIRVWNGLGEFNKKGETCELGEKKKEKVERARLFFGGGRWSFGSTSALSQTKRERHKEERYKSANETLAFVGRELFEEGEKKRAQLHSLLRKRKEGSINAGRHGVDF